MCGIAGFWDFSQTLNASELERTVAQMADTLAMRGPDSSGIWVDPSVGISFAHRRLAVVDLSVEGHQPMHSACGRFVIIFNGEIYNYQDLRKELTDLGIVFRGYSDTEVMLAAICQWGIRASIEKFNGMFAFALWDKAARKLTLARDRFGEKPLYYGQIKNTFFFASELKSLSIHPDFQPSIDRDVLSLYLRHNYVPSPYSIYKNVYKLPSACFLDIPFLDRKPLPLPICYWSIREVAQNGISHPIYASEAEVVSHLEILLKDAVKLRMEADVPLGAFLSGGIDSSTVVALMQEQSKQAVKTFTIGFHEKAFNEADQAKNIAKHLGTDHTELYVTPEESMAVIPSLPSIYDEPFADVSQIPTYLLSKLARQDVTVSLSGDGADELFAGYPRYFIGDAICKRVGWIPLKGRALISKYLENKSVRHLPLGAKIQRLGAILSHDNVEKMYREMISHLHHPSEVVLNTVEPDTIFSDSQQWVDTPNFMQRMMYIDSLSYLPDDILTKVDRASMAVSLESRTPFLDFRIAEMAWRLPIAMHVRSNKGKRLLRQVLYRYVPKKYLDRPKKGFGVPIGLWLRGPLREWAEALLNETRLKNDGFFDVDLICGKWKEHLSGKYNRQYFLWTVLMFQSWLRMHERS